MARKILRSFPAKLKKSFVFDLSLASQHVFDLTKLYLTIPNDQIAYHNILFSIAMSTTPETILELGTGPGNSSIAFARVLQYFNRYYKRSGFLHTCDLDPKTHVSLKKKKCSNQIKYYLMSTDDLAIQWKNNPLDIDLLYIDADHSHEQSMKDFESFAPYVKPDGIILFHDTFPLSPSHEQLTLSGTAYQTAQKIKREYAEEYEISTIPHLSGISIVRKRGKKYF